MSHCQLTTFAMLSLHSNLPVLSSSPLHSKLHYCAFDSRHSRWVWLALTYTLSSRRGALRSSRKSLHPSPSLSVSWILHAYLPLYWPSPAIPWVPSLLLTLWLPNQGLLGDVSMCWYLVCAECAPANLSIFSRSAIPFSLVLLFGIDLRLRWYPANKFVASIFEVALVVLQVWRCDALSFCLSVLIFSLDLALVGGGVVESIKDSPALNTEPSGTDTLRTTPTPRAKF